MQAALDGWTRLLELENGRVRVVHLEHRMTGSNLQQAHIGGEHQNRDDVTRSFAGQFLDPAKAEIDDIGQQDDPADRQQNTDDAVYERGHVVARNPAYVCLAGLKVHNVKKCDVGHQGRQGGMFDDLGIGECVHVI